MKEIGIAKNFIPLKRGKKRRRYSLLQMGGFTSPIRKVDVEYEDFYNPEPTVMPDEPIATSPESSSSLGKNLGNIGRRISDFAPYVNNIAATFRDLPPVPVPTLETGISADTVDFSGDIANLERDVRGANLGTRVLNPSLGRSVRVANLGKFLEQKGKLSQEQKNINANILNRARMFNQGINARNIERINQMREEAVARTIAQQNLNSENLADFSTKMQLERRDRDLMALEDRKWDFLERRYKDTGVVGRNLSDLIEEEKYMKKKYGGKLKRKRFL